MGEGVIRPVGVYDRIDVDVNPGEAEVVLELDGDSEVDSEPLLERLLADEKEFRGLYEMEAEDDSEKMDELLSKLVEVVVFKADILDV